MSSLQIKHLGAINIIAGLLFLTGGQAFAAKAAADSTTAVIIGSYDHPRYRDRPYYYFDGKYYYGGEYRNENYYYKDRIFYGGRYYP